MQAITFCSRCRGMKVGWNGRYLRHCLICKDLVSTSSKLLILTVLLAVLVLAFPTPSAFVYSSDSGDNIEQGVVEMASFEGPVMPLIDPAIRSIEGFLKGNGVDASHRGRVAESIVASAKKYNLDSRLIASIVIVESRANPFAISGSDSIGVMQIHLPTWGRTADREGINLFKIEDNIDFGARILKDYVRQSGVWDGVKRYKGWTADDPESEQAAHDYLTRIQRIYSIQNSANPATDLLQ